MISDKKVIRVAVDAMGGDYAPVEVIKGIVAAAQECEVEIILVGPLATLETELSEYAISNLPIKCINADEVIKEGEPPAIALRQKRNASVVVATKLVKNGEADAIISAGPTGAVVASALMILGMAEGIERPIVGGPLFGFSPNTIVMDAGGNVDCKPFHLLNFAVVGCVYAQKMLNITNPTVALLSVGVEEGKGNELVKESYPLFQKSGLNFIGNVEGNDITTGGANVIVCDGFVGNILIKFCEGMGASIARWLETNLCGKLPDSEICKISDNLIALTNTADMAGGGPLLGVNGVSIVMHGRSQAQQYTKAVSQAKAVVESGLVDSLNSELTKIRRQLDNE